MKALRKALILTNNILKPLLQDSLEEQTEEVRCANKRESMPNSSADLILHLGSHLPEVSLLYSFSQWSLPPIYTESAMTC